MLVVSLSFVWREAWRVCCCLHLYGGVLSAALRAGSFSLPCLSQAPILVASYAGEGISKGPVCVLTVADCQSGPPQHCPAEPHCLSVRAALGAASLLAPVTDPALLSSVVFVPSLCPGIALLCAAVVALTVLSCSFHWPWPPPFPLCHWLLASRNGGLAGFGCSAPMACLPQDLPHLEDYLLRGHFSFLLGTAGPGSFLHMT